MTLTVDYYFSPQSPWAYLGHARFVAMVREAGARVNLRPVDLGGKVFPVSGGLPLGQRAPQRQAYRLVELRRFADHLGVPLNLHPKFFPVAADDAARLIIAVDQIDGSEAAMALTGALLRAVWADERNLADAADLAAVLAAQPLPAQRLADSRAADVQARYDAESRRAVEAGVFGAPSYVVDGEIFWGQDRLDFLARRLAR
jgi:2-hydroxychromene-2-carboxylate isomerase